MSAECHKLERKFLKVIGLYFAGQLGQELVKDAGPPIKQVDLGHQTNSNFIMLNLSLRADSKVQRTKTKFIIHVQGCSKCHAPWKTMEYWYIDGDYGGYAQLQRYVEIVNVAQD